MNGLALHTLAADCAEELPGAGLEHPFGDEWEVFKVRGKVFMLMTEIPGRPVVILKADPGEAHALQQQNSHITPGYHMNKKHWITVEGGEDIDKTLVRELVTDSYRLVVARLPTADQPVDPHVYGTSMRAEAVR
ncbi:MmcQ/YjbR family DNA-binding protein [Streptomyces sp. NPDC054855]